MLKKRTSKNHTYSYQQQHSNGTNAVKHKLVLIKESLTAVAVISLQHLVRGSGHLVWYNYHITTYEKPIIINVILKSMLNYYFLVFH
jgi:hypothetical protein